MASRVWRHLDAAPSDSSSALALAPERTQVSPRTQPSLANGSGSQGQPRVHVHLTMPPPKANPRFCPESIPQNTSQFEAEELPTSSRGGSQPSEGQTGRGPISSSGRTLVSSPTPESDCFLQIPGAPGPCSGPGPDSYFSLSAKGLSFIMQFTLIFFFFFVNTFMNEDSVLPNLLPDLLPTRAAQLPGRGWGSGGLLGGVPDHCSEQPLPPSLGVSTKQGAHLLKPFSPWGSSEHSWARLFLLLAALLH